MTKLYSSYLKSSFDISGALFDFDGTLLDSLGAWQELEEYLVSLSQEEVTQDQRAAFGSMTIPEIGQLFYEHYGVGKNSASVVSLIDEYMTGYYETKVILKPGVEGFLEAAMGKGIRMSVVSASPQSYLQAGVNSTGIREYFQDIVSVNDLNTTKREPLIYQHAHSLLGTPKESTWGFEDSLYALKTLTDDGYKTVGIFDLNEKKSLDYWRSVTSISVESFEQLSFI